VTEEIHIVAVGARTPLGMSSEASFAAVRAGITEISDHPFLVDREMEPVRLAMDFELAPELMGVERFSPMAITAIEEVCQKMESIWQDYRTLPLFLGLPEERPGWNKEHMKIVKENIQNSPLPIELEPLELFPYGHAAGLIALEAACKQLRKGLSNFCVIAGVDSYLDLQTLEWLDDNRQLANSYNRGAFFPGEGAGAIVIAPKSIVQKYRLESLGVVRGIGLAVETKMIKTDAVCLGEGLTNSVKKAVSILQLPRDAVEGIICDMNGERYRSEEWSFALLRLPNAMIDPTDHDLPASNWGDMGAASGSLFVALAVTAGRQNWAKGQRYLVWNSSENGHRAAAVLDLIAQHNGEH